MVDRRWGLETTTEASHFVQQSYLLIAVGSPFENRTATLAFIGFTHLVAPTLPIVLIVTIAQLSNEVGLWGQRYDLVTIPAFWKHAQVRM